MTRRGPKSAAAELEPKVSAAQKEKLNIRDLSHCRPDLRPLGGNGPNHCTRMSVITQNLEAWRGDARTQSWSEEVEIAVDLDDTPSKETREKVERARARKQLEYRTEVDSLFFKLAVKLFFGCVILLAVSVPLLRKD